MLPTYLPAAAASIDLQHGFPVCQPDAAVANILLNLLQACQGFKY